MAPKEESQLTRLSLLSVLLTVLFVGLKLTDQINWNWLFVISPYFAPFFVKRILNLTFSTILLTINFIKELSKQNGKR